MTAKAVAASKDQASPSIPWREPHRFASTIRRSSSKKSKMKRVAALSATEVFSKWKPRCNDALRHLSNGNARHLFQ